MEQQRATANSRAVRKAARSEELLDAAIRAIRLDGAGTSIERVAAEAGITRPVIYRHFGAAAGLYQAVAERYADDLLAHAGAATAGVRGGRALVRAQVDGYLAFLEAEPNLYRFLTRQVPAGAHGEGNVVSGFVQQLGGMIAGFLESTGVAPMRAAVAGRSFVGAIHFTSEWWLEDPQLSRSELTDELVAMLWDGMDAVVTPAAVTR